MWSTDLSPPPSFTFEQDNVVPLSELQAPFLNRSVSEVKDMVGVFGHAPSFATAPLQHHAPLNF